jgi:hypothetical protein
MWNIVQKTQKKKESWPLGAAVVSWLMVGTVIIGCSLLLSTYLNSPALNTTFQTQTSLMPVQLLCGCPFGCRVMAFGLCTQQANPGMQSTPMLMSVGQTVSLLLCPGTIGQELIAMAPNVSIMARQGRVDGVCVSPEASVDFAFCITINTGHVRLANAVDAVSDGGGCWNPFAGQSLTSSAHESVGSDHGAARNAHNDLGRRHDARSELRHDHARAL